MMQSQQHEQGAIRPLFITLLIPLALLATLLFNSLPLAAQEAAPDEAASAVEPELLNAAIAAPVHEGPAADSTRTALTDPPVGMPTLSWNAVPGATRYNVQISVSEGFATTVVNQDTVATSFTPREVLADGTYFWRVRAQQENEWGNFSQSWSFHKQWSAEGQIRPLLLSPANDPDGQQVITAFSPEHFSWEPVVGAAAYIFEASLSPSFNDAQPYRITTLKTHHTPVTQFANNQYYWRVTPLDARDHAGEPSEVRTFTFGWNQVPQLLTPEDELDTRFLPRFAWTAVPGASLYILEISSQENFSERELEVATRNTSYTPESALANNKDYFWRVRAVSPRQVNGPPSEVRSFRANWIQPPTLLSPLALGANHIYPYFSWTPVAGAKSYQLQIDTDNGFEGLIADVTLINATSYTQPEWPEIDTNKAYWWRVRAKDARGNTTNWSSEQSFRFSATPPPNLIYPEPYYTPDSDGMPVHTNRTVAHPVFVWDTTHQSNGNGPAAFVYPDYYRLEVATAREFRNEQIIFSIDTAGNAAAPTLAHPFSQLEDGESYFWRVTPYRSDELEPMAYGIVWEMRIDRTVPQLPLDSDTVPDLLHPQAGFISVESAPVLGWLPVANSAYYEVEVSKARTFEPSNVVDHAEALFAYYVPWQGRKTPMPPGAYWWRVRAKHQDSDEFGEWSSVRHFLVMDNLMTGNVHDYKIPGADNTLLSAGDPILYDAQLSQVATDTISVAHPYNVGALHVVQDNSISPGNRSWVVAFGVDESVTEPVSYALYFDVNQKENVGGTTDPLGKSITIDPLYLPEYVIYLDRVNDAVVGGYFYKWTPTGWEGYSLVELEGTFFYDPKSKAIQVSFDYPYIIMESTDQFSGALALTVYSANANALVDSMPHQGASLSRPALFSNMPVPLYPFDTPLSNPTVFHELPTLRWRMPHYNSTDGYIVQVARNPNFTEDTIVETWSTTESNTYSYYGGAPTAFHSGISYRDDESYYWRLRYRHESYGGSSEYDVGPWSPPMRFKLTSYQPGNPTVTLGNPALGEAALATPSFVWERVEGASRYTIQIDNDFNMNSPLLEKTTDGNSFTAVETLEDGTYYWRVAMRRDENVLGQWTSIISFTKSSLVPSLITPVNNVVINAQPTFIWAAAISNTGELHVAAPRYRLQWDDNPQFNSPETVETEATSYTPLKGQSLDDGTWFWRVAIIDGNGKRGPDSAPATFYKEYLQPQTVSPVMGSSDGHSITFEWSPLAGAASYRLEIDDNAAFDSPQQVTTENTRYTHTEQLEAGEYHWRVQMVDRDGRPGPTIPGKFTQAPEVPVNDGPALFMPFVVGP